MFSKRSLIGLAIVGVVVFVGLGGVNGAASLLAKPTAVAVVDLQAVFDRAAIREQFKADQQQKAEQLQLIQKEKQNALADMEMDLKARTPGTDNFNSLQSKLELKALEYRIWAEYENNKLIKGQGLQLEKLYRDTLSVIASVAKEQGYDLVLYKESAPNFRWENPQQLSGQIQLRKMLYSADEVDITDEVIQRLNNEYSAG